MHDTPIGDIKFNLDYVDRSATSCFLSGWIYSAADVIESLRVEIPGQITQETGRFESRADINKFYGLPENVNTGFKFILNPEDDFSSLVFSVKLQDRDDFQVINTTNNPHQYPAHTLAETKPVVPDIGINNPFPGMIVVENFYDDPDRVREYAMSQVFQSNSAHHKGARTQTRSVFKNTKEFFEGILHKRITHWDEHVYNGVFQYCVAEDPLVYHTDHQAYAAVVFLTPDAPVECGTSFFKSRHNGLMRAPTPADSEKTGKPAETLVKEMFDGNYYDRTRWEVVDVIGNVYNRMVIWDARKVHAASAYFGDSLENSRLFHMFFFDAE